MTSPWPLVELAQVAEVQRGTMITRKTSQEGSIPVIAGGLGPAYFHSDSNRPPGTITVSGSGANAGYVSFWSTPIFASDCSTVITKNVELISQEFLFVFLKSNQEHIMTKLRQGAAQPHVYPKDIQKLLVPIPPLDEQKRIVAKLDDALGVVEDLKANTAQAKSELNALWISALTESLSGEWPVVKLGDIANLLKRGISPRYSESSLVRVINQRCIRNSELDVSLARYHDVEQKPIREELFLSKGDLLVNSTGVGTVGRSAVIENDLTEKLTLDSHVTLIRSKLELVYSLYLKMYFQLIQQKIENLAEGSGGQVELSRSAISAIDIPLPPLDEQKRIVSKLDAVKIEIDRQREILEAKELETERLRSSILTAAFNGEL